jgi:hypothetical protein
LRRLGGNAELPEARQDHALINSAVAALCEAVRDYAIFIMNPEGIIVSGAWARI